METGLFINGEFVNAESGETFETLNPATEEVITSVQAAGEADVNKAVAAAKEAFKTWRFTDGSHRRNLLLKVADLIEKHRKQLSDLESLDNGKPPHVADGVDLGFVIECYRYYAGWADKIGGKTVSATQGSATNFCYTRHEPVGVCGLIVPWNFPLLMQAWKLGPALAMGCTCVMKLSEKTPLTGIMICQLFKEAGFPPGVLNVVNGYGDPTGALLARHPDISKIAFTGSTAVGKKVAIMAAESNLKKVTLELGGKSALIVHKDADLDQAAIACHVGNWINMGQVCTASSRVFVHEDVYDEFAKKVTKLAKRLRTNGQYEGDTDVPICDLGPQVDKIQFDKIMGFIKSGKKQGATCLLGGERGADKGYFIQPTIFGDVTDDMKIAKNEIFGPVMSMLKYKTLEEAIQRANSTPYGLAAAVMTRDVGTAHHVAHRLDAGSVWVNCYHNFDMACPFGGFKESGWGREKGEYALENYTSVKCVIMPIDPK